MVFITLNSNDKFRKLFNLIFSYWLNMTKRKLHCVIKDSTQINTVNKKSEVADVAEKYSTYQNSCMLTITELYSNENIKLILLHYMPNKVVDVHIFDYDVNKEKDEQWCKQVQKIIKKLKFDRYKFESSQLTEKFYILAQQDNNAVITAASIIRFFTQDDGKQAIRIIALIDYLCAFLFFSQFNEDSISDKIDTNILCKRRCGILMKSEGIDIGKFIEVIKLKINNIDNLININEDVLKVIEVPSNNYKIVHQEIINKYKIKFQGNEERGNYSSEEDEILDVMDLIKDTIEDEEIICEVVEQLITRVVKKCERREKKISWDISVVDNEGRTRNNKEVKLNDREAIEIFAKAVETWDIELFKEAKEKSNDFVKLVDFFDEEIMQEFWGHFFRNIYHKGCLTDHLNSENLHKHKIKYANFVQKVSNGYNFLISNIPSVWDKLRQQQLHRFSTPCGNDNVSKVLTELKINPVQVEQNKNINDSDLASSNM